jgi:hypothetical protein
MPPGLDAVLVNVKVAKINFLTSPGTFCLFAIEPVLCHYGKHFTDMFDVFRQSMTVNGNRVRVYSNEFAFHWCNGEVLH